MYQRPSPTAIRTCERSSSNTFPPAAFAVRISLRAHMVCFLVRRRKKAEVFAPSAGAALVLPLVPAEGAPAGRLVVGGFGLRKLQGERRFAFRWYPVALVAWTLVACVARLPVPGVAWWPCLVSAAGLEAALSALLMFAGPLPVAAPTVDNYRLSDGLMCDEK
jgi:hypothetical protein